MSWAKAARLTGARTRTRPFGKRDEGVPRVEREHRHAANAASAGALFSPAGSAWVWRTDRACGLHAERPGRKEEVGLEGRLFRRPRLLPTVSRASGCSAREVPWMGAQRHLGSHAHGRRLCSSFVSDGSCIGFALRALRAVGVDPGT